MKKTLPAILIILAASAAAVSAYSLDDPVSRWADGTIRMSLRLGTPASGQSLGDGSATWDQVAETALARWNSALANSRVQFTSVHANGNGDQYDKINEVFWS